VAQFGQDRGLDLPDPLAGDPVHLADLVQRPGPAVGQAEAQPHDTCLALGQRGEHRVELLLQQRERHRVDGHHGLGVLDEVAELGVALVADRLVGVGGVGDNAQPLSGVETDLDALREIDLLRSIEQPAWPICWR
jgi:hypothetical protein